MRSKNFAANRAARIALVGNTLRARARADKLALHTSATLHHKQALVLQQVQALYAAQGLAVPSTLSVRAPGMQAQRHAPSAQSGACAKVRELAATHKYDRAATLAACKAAGINPATAATQFANAKRLHAAQQ